MLNLPTVEPDADCRRPHAQAAPGGGERGGFRRNNLGKRFKNRPVVRDVTLTVNRGEAVGLLGPNGAGKTTCFYMITGLISPDYGKIVMDSVDISDLPMYRRARLGIGYLPQEASIFRGLTVEQNIRAVLEVIEPRADLREPRLDELLAEFNHQAICAAPRRWPCRAGERRRCEIARALASKPSFMLLDEPSPASTRSRCATSASWCRICASAASAS